MKKISLLILFILSISNFLIAQKANHNRVQAKEKLEAQRIAFITNKLELSPEEAQTFWPIYNEYKQNQKALKKTIIKPKKLMDATDKEIEEYLTKSLDLEEKQIDLKRQYYQKLKGAISVKKIAKLIITERAFTKMVLKRMNERAAHRKRNN